MKVQLLESFIVPAGSVSPAELEYQTDPDWVAIIVYVPNEHIEVQDDALHPPQSTNEG